MAILKLLIVLTLCMVSSVLARTEQDYNRIHADEEYLKHYLAEQDKRIFNEFRRFQDMQFIQRVEDPKRIFDEYVKVMSVINDTSHYLKQYDLSTLVDLDLKRQVEAMINSVGLYILDKNTLDQLHTSLQTLHLLPTRREICPYRANEYQRCDLSYIGNVSKIISTSRDPEELKHYWLQWRGLLKRYGTQELDYAIYVYRRAARMNHQEPIDLWFKDYEDRHFLNDLTDVMTQIEIFYKDLHAYIRDILHKQYGDNVISPNGPIPHHLYEQVLNQAWDPNSVVQPPYPNKKLPDFKYELEHGKYGGRNLVVEAEKFFQGLGMRLPDSFWRKNLKQKPEEGFGDECKAVVYDFIPDGALEYCPQTNFKKFLQMHGYLARLHYIENERNLPFAFYDSYNFEHGVAEAVILSASSPKHIEKIRLLPHYTYDEQSNFNRLFRLAIHTMLNLPIYYVQSRLLSDILTNHVELQHINSHYWYLMEKYAGIEPPTDRLGTDLDFPFKFFEDLTENHQTRKFVGEVLGYQFYRALCETSGQYNRNDTRTKLHNCDFSDSVTAGHYLKTMMAAGSSKPWRQVLQKLLRSDPDMNAGALMAFFEPVREFLQKRGLKPGWESSNKIIHLDKPPRVPMIRELLPTGAPNSI